MAQSYPTPDQKKLSSVDNNYELIYSFNELVHHDDLYHYEKAIAVKSLLKEKQLQAWVSAGNKNTPLCSHVTAAYITDHCGTILVEKTGLGNKNLTEIDLCAIFNELASGIEEKRYTVMIERLVNGMAFDTYEVMTRDWHAFAAISYCFFDVIDGINKEAGDLIPFSIEQKLRMLSVRDSEFAIALNDRVEYKLVSVDITKD